MPEKKTRPSFGMENSRALVVETLDGSRGPVTPFCLLPLCVTHGTRNLATPSTTHSTGGKIRNSGPSLREDANGPEIIIRCDPMQCDCQPETIQHRPPGPRALFHKMKLPATITTAAPHAKMDWPTPRQGNNLLWCLSNALIQPSFSALRMLSNLFESLACSFSALGWRRRDSYWVFGAGLVFNYLRRGKYSCSLRTTLEATLVSAAFTNI